MSNPIIKDNEQQQESTQKGQQKSFQHCGDKCKPSQDECSNNHHAQQERMSEPKKRSTADPERVDKFKKMSTPRFVSDFNKRHAVIHHNKTYILTEKYDAVLSRPIFSLEPVSSFHAWYKTKRDAEGKSLSPAWLAHPQRREYPGGIVFDPKNPGHNGGRYNLFQGFSIKAKQGVCALFWQLVEEGLAGGDKGVAGYIRKWLAHMIQCPWELPEVALAFRGLQGTGKGTFMQYVHPLVSPHYLELSQMGQVVGRFNSHLKDLILVYANEALWGGNKAETGALKAMITDRFQAIEQKGVDIVTVQNCKRLVLSSNEDWIAPLDIDDRRFLVTDVNPKFRGNTEFFKRVEAEKTDGGLAALMWDLQNEDISNWHPRDKPSCVDGFDLKLRSMKTPHRWLYDCLSKKILPDPDTQDATWSSACSIRKERIYQHYKNFCENCSQRNNSSIPEYDGHFWKMIKQILDPLNDSRHREGELRLRLLEWPSLIQGRDAFARFAGEDSDKLWAT